MFAFPNPVNEKAARVVAGGVLVLAVLTALTGWAWLAALMAVGFALRVYAGPRFSPLGRLAASVIAPRLGPARLVAGPPKQFAQSIGLVFTVAAAVLGFAGLATPALVVILVLALFAGLESLLGFCAGCWVFARLMQAGLIPQEICEACTNINLRTSADRTSADRTSADRN